MATRLAQIGQSKCNAIFCIGNYDGVTDEKPHCRRGNKLIARAFAPYPGSALNRAKRVEKTAKKQQSARNQLI